MTSPAVLTQVRGAVLVITMNRPQVRNAINLEVARGIAAALDRLDADPGLRAGIITGAGGTFCAGMDLKAFSAGEIPKVPGRGFAGLVAAPPRTPLIAAVEGYALAGGFEIVLACDLVVAAEGAVFGLPEVQRGLTPAAGGLFRLPRRIPYHLAMELVLTGRRWPAPEAAAAGLVARLTPDGGALEAAHELATQIAENAPLAVAASKRVILESADWSAEESFARQEDIVGPVRSSQDAAEGARAFVEKRQPVWQER
jgi:enoyl-CoA hydratase